MSIVETEFRLTVDFFLEANIMKKKMGKADRTYRQEQSRESTVTALSTVETPA